MWYLIPPKSVRFARHKSQLKRFSPEIARNEINSIRKQSQLIPTVNLLLMLLQCFFSLKRFRALLAAELLLSVSFVCLQMTSQILPRIRSLLTNVTLEAIRIFMFDQNVVTQFRFVTEKLLTNVAFELLFVSCLMMYNCN